MKENVVSLELPSSEEITEDVAQEPEREQNEAPISKEVIDAGEVIASQTE